VSVAVPTRSPEVLATRSGPCAFDCDDRIVKGEDYIVCVDGKGWMHAACAQSYLRFRAVFEELNQDDGADAVGEES
jgi:hypothetical protein